MAAAYITATAVSFTKPRRMEGHTSNVENPIFYEQFGTITLETTEAGDTFIIPSKIPNIYWLNVVGGNAAGGLVASGDGTNVGAWSSNEMASIFIQTTTAQVAGSTTLILAGTPAGYGINDAYNGATVDIRFSNGDVQTTTITDFVASGTVATLAEGLNQAVAATGTYYRIRGPVLTIPTVATTPILKVHIIGTF